MKSALIWRDFPFILRALRDLGSYMRIFEYPRTAQRSAFFEERQAKCRLHQLPVLLWR